MAMTWPEFKWSPTLELEYSSNSRSGIRAGVMSSQQPDRHLLAAVPLGAPSESGGRPRPTRLVMN